MALWRLWLEEHTSDVVLRRFSPNTTRLASDDASLVICGGDGGNRTRVRRTRSGTSTSVVGLLSLARGVTADRATPGPSRWEPKLPLEHSYRHRSAARQLLYARPPDHRRETRADVTVCAVSLSPGRIRLPLERRPLRPAGRESKCYWHFGICAPLLTGAERPGLPSVANLPRRSLSSPRNNIITRICYIDKPPGTGTTTGKGRIRILCALRGPTPRTTPG